MRNIIVLAAVVGFAWAQDGNVPEGLESPNAGRGGAADYLDGFPAKDATAEQRHAALLLLPDVPDTADYIDGPVGAALRADLVRLLRDDLKTAAWADIA